jgi:MFS transporter, ACS family, hexuronate transporter
VPTVGRYRWAVCALLVLATACNYMDRQVMSILAPELGRVFQWNEAQYGYVVAGFQATYTLGFLFFGWLVDRIGTKRCYALSVSLWSFAACAHAFTHSILGFGAMRMALGISEGGNFPSAIKAVTEWFPKEERALATGFVTAGANIGAVISPALIPWLALTWGWRTAFAGVGLLGFVWVLFWIVRYERPERETRLDPSELVHITGDQPDAADASEDAIPSISLRELLGHRQTWGFIVGKLLTDPIWWFLLYWLPKFLNERHGLDLSHVGPPLIVVYLMSSTGSVAGGWLSGFLIGRDWTVDRARKVTLLISALCVVPIIAASTVTNLWTAVFLIGLAAAGHQGWSATIYTTTSDMFPRRSVGSVTGVGGMAGSFGGILFSTGVGWLLQATHDYHVLFVISGCAYVVAFVFFCLLVARVEPGPAEHANVPTVP